MISHGIATHHDDDLDTRIRRITGKILDGIEATLAELAQPRAAIDHAQILDEAERAAQRALLLCRQALCRRANRCRRQLCTVPAADFPTS